MRGEMLFFNHTNGFGFIRTEDGERLYVHRDGFQPGTPPVGRCAGKKVTFERQELDDPEHSHQATGVTMLEEVVGNRARLRRSGGVR
jgi:cold shock CspA family protein